MIESREQQVLESKSLLIFDLSNPRTVEETCSSIENINLFNMDEIGDIVKRNIQFRQKEIQSD